MSSDVSSSFCAISYLLKFLINHQTSPESRLRSPDLMNVCMRVKADLATARCLRSCWRRVIPMLNVGQQLTWCEGLWVSHLVLVWLEAVLQVLTSWGPECCRECPNGTCDSLRWDKDPNLAGGGQFDVPKSVSPLEGSKARCGNDVTASGARQSLCSLDARCVIYFRVS